MSYTASQTLDRVIVVMNERLAAGRQDTRDGRRNSCATVYDRVKEFVRQRVESQSFREAGKAIVQDQAH